MKRNFAHPFFDAAPPLVLGHRGAAGEQPENTLASFQRALDQGADVLETDVHLSRDGVVVVAHDDDLARMTDGHGPLAARNLAELRALDAGHGFTPDGGASFPERGRGHRIPRLAEVLEAFPGARLNIELKRDSKELTRAVLAELRAARRESQALLAAGDDGAMRTLRAVVAEQQSGVALGASLAEVVAFVKAAASAPPHPRDPSFAPENFGVMALQVPPEFAGAPLVTPAFLAHAHAHGVQVHVWTVNEPREIERLLALGVDGVMSDYPARVVRARSEFEARSADALN